MIIGRNHHFLIGVALGLLMLTQAPTASADTEGFVPNAGRLDPLVQYYGTSSTVDIFFTTDGVVFDIKDTAALEQLHDSPADDDNQLPLPTRRGQALHLTFPNAQEGVELVPGNENNARNSFFFGNEPRNWISDQASFRTLTYRNLWNGVDLVFTLESGRLSYEVVARDGGDSAAATLEWTGADEILTSDSGTELITTFGSIVDNGTNIGRPVEASDENLIFASRGVGALLWSTLVGGTGDDEGASLAVASNGDIIVTGETYSPDFPGTPGAYEEAYFDNVDIFVSRFTDEGATLVWSSFIGTSSNDYVNALCLDASDNPIIGGRTYRYTYPVTVGAYDESYNGGISDATVTKLTSDGSSLMFSTFVGGSDVDSFFDLVPDPSGNLVCAGYTGSTDYPVTPGAYQATFAGPPYDFTVSTLSADGSTLLAGTYIGGSDRDACRGVGVDANGDVFLAGFSFSTDFPVSAGAFQTVKSDIDDASLVKMSADMTTLIWSTYIGGDNSERAHAVDLDSSGNPVMAGYSLSSNFPTSTGALQETTRGSMEGFIAKFDNVTGARTWSTYLGGNYGDDITSIVLDASDNPVVTGLTTSTNFHVNNLGYDDTANGGDDIFVSRVSADGTSLLWGTYLGGIGDETGMEVAMDGDDNPVVTGMTDNASFPVSSWAYDGSHNGGNDAILARFDTGSANLSIAAATNAIGCGTSSLLTFSYTPDLPHTPPLRGYSVRIQAPFGLTFEPSDITVLSPLVGINDTFQIIENATGDCTIDFSFLDQGAGLTEVADLFTINFTGENPGLATVGIASGIFRDEDNHPFDVDILSTADISVDCTPADVPTMDAEPIFTAGTSNTVSWSDESGSGAATYLAQVSSFSDFSVISAESGYVAGLSHEFTGLTSGALYYYRVISRTASNQNSAPSASVSSTQDNDSPISSVDALAPALGATFGVAFTASDIGSGLESVELFYNFDGGAFVSAGIHTVSPISFTGTNGDGIYGFYTVALDSVGNTEAAPGSADTSTSVDTSAPDAPTLDAETLFTAGTANTVTSSDESGTGAVTYNFQISQLVDFSVVDSESGAIAGLSHEFTGLTDGVTYYYRVAAYDNLNNVSDFSTVINSTQDDSAPASSATTLANQNTATFGVAFSAIDVGVGIETVELFTNFDGGAFSSNGTFSTSPAAFTAANGEGSYGFYTVATDSLGNAEIDPGAAQASCVLDMTAPESSADALAAYQTSGVFDIPISGSDNLVGIASYELFYQLNAGAWTSAGTADNGTFSFTSAGDGDYGFYSVATDSVGNTEADATEADATTSVDTNGPTGTFVIEGGIAAINDTSVTLSSNAVGALEMRFSNDNISFTEGWVSYNANHAWIIGSTEGTQTVYGEFRDIAGNLLQITDTIEYDLQPTGGVTYLELSPMHESVSLTWHNPDESDLAHVEIWRGLLHDSAFATSYPDYVDNTVPAQPADRAAIMANPEWVLAGTISGGAEAFNDTIVDRGVYYYEIFAVDNAGNFSAPHSLMPAATNYLLGDMATAFDGLVAVDDLTTLGASYGLNDGHVDFNKHADIGPTDDFSGAGIPQPDDYVGFDDLMITTNNYGLSAKSGAATKTDKSQGPVILSWDRIATRTFALRLHSEDTGLKGFNISSPLPQSASVTVTVGELLREQDQPVFLQNVPSHGLDAGCALIGSGLSIIGVGELVVVTLSEDADPSVLELENLEFILRGADNQDLVYSFEMTSSVEIPTSFAMGSNFPNPFNPSTSISFSLPQEEQVRLEIYGVNGRRVAVLVSEAMPAGNHQVTWAGRDESGHLVASGVYFYRIRAGKFTDVQKMTLMK